ncbi:hypothetical protein PROFUN_05285 [Planoprotostelium fungivorum]|uniref:Uncharacterized protein n=1 Tax=Planoprotostelium fungivorum TaxID=1890364 RepID=A0A2P6NRB5_9EUKA|nr:hypothetical protein PROFUN_05285 [Planoprotostelium fungivorum]
MLPPNGFGTLPLPLHPLFVTELKKTGEQKNDKFWEWRVEKDLDGMNQFRITSSEWMEHIRETVKFEDDTNAKISVEPVKMILEESGGHYIFDEKNETDDHFASLLVVLPTHHTDMDGRSHFQTVFFFNEAERIESKAITSGHRLFILFHLLSRENRFTPKLFHPDNSLMRRFESGLEGWLDDLQQSSALCLYLDQIYGVDADTCTLDGVYARDVMREKMIKVMSQRLGFDCVKCRALNGEGDISLEHVGTLSIRSEHESRLIPHTSIEDNILNHAKEGAAVLLFFVRLEDVIINYATDHHYVHHLMRQILPHHAQKNCTDTGQLQRLPKDILKYIMREYIPTHQLGDVYNASPACRDVISRITWRQVKTFTERALREKKFEWLFTWDELLSHDHLMKILHQLKTILVHIPAQDVSWMEKLSDIAEIYGWNAIRPHITSYVIQTKDDETIRRIADALYTIKDDAAVVVYRHLLFIWIEKMKKDPFPLHVCPPIWYHLSLASRYDDLHGLWSIYNDSEPSHSETDVSTTGKGEKKRDWMSHPAMRDIAQETLNVTKRYYLREVGVDNWSFPYHSSCRCKECKRVEAFYQDANKRETTVKCDKAKMNHIKMFWSRQKIIIQEGFDHLLIEKTGKLYDENYGRLGIYRERMEWLTWILHGMK